MVRLQKQEFLNQDLYADLESPQHEELHHRTTADLSVPPAPQEPMINKSVTIKITHYRKRKHYRKNRDLRRFLFLFLFLYIYFL